ncbi:hypothetical protein A2875_02865 [Candidatus Gottesmanbacteria bacterium RIFCSPHIGHO2_01_FULL_46_14]|uniref:GlcNAc-PI de-N-acetylase n=3 Tax=Microgenomates group TaxID=1794810 RepID=A0A1F5ZPM0_9BACT|nr:MAG: N-acetylglucosaminylphosphatidylinositol deacetylase [Candidatus Curtissbacteria bacterium GW2011_GWA1_41_11]OGG14446.1 MAG: hypothetical protein A2875_02865 [Candidatus Gottesmanbacteria bacterium RIFCSPHIGHO2_01_FULL_46_14]OGG28537.1 MAG: hypothetical protein A2971_03570 [Candidatus Gottesmanbacteria bacterium RIFCSPLOWO2_01_FULL_46_21]
MLLVFAHPDDELFACGGTIAKYARNGWEIDLICATRQKELESAAKLLGIRTIHFLNYKDGTLKEDRPGDLEDTLDKYLRTLAPSIVITFEPGGISNHPDHIRLTRAATYAFQKYAKTITHVQAIGISPDRPPRHPRDAWQIEFAEVTFDQTTPKLYYVCIPKSVGDYLIKAKLYPPEILGKPWSTTPDKFITTVIDTHLFQKKKEAALNLHKTQEEDVKRFLADPGKALLAREFFILRMQGEQEVFMGKSDRVSDRL